MMKAIGGLAFAALAAASAAAAEFHVSPDGDDRNDGSAAKPVKTLQRALDLTRKIEREEDKDIVMRDGFYPFEKPVIFRADDYDVTVRAEHRRKAVLSGAVKLTGWKKDDLNDRFLVAELPFEPVEDVNYMLTCGGEDRPVAVYPEKRRMRFKGGEDKGLIAYGADTFPDGTDLKALDLASVWVEIPQEWATTITRIKGIDTEVRTIALQKKATYPFSRFNQGFRMYNCRLGMTQPGSWMYETTAKKVIYWPREGETAENIDCRITRAGALLITSRTSGVTFRGLVLEGCMKALDLAKANPYAETPILAAIFMGMNSRNVVVDDCEVHHCANTGIYATKPDHCVVRNCHVHDVGGDGINFFDGGDASDVLNCEVNDYGKGAAASMGIHMQLSNVKCIGNHVHHGSGNGVVMWSSNSVFASNELHHVMQRQRDGGGLYGGFKDSVLRDNYVHDIGWPGLYVDEGSQRVLYTGNRFENCGWPIHVHSSQYVTVSNNVFRNDGGFRFSFQGSGHGVFCDNKIYTVEPVKYDSYLASCDFWGRNELYIRQPDGSYKLKETVSLERQKAKTGTFTTAYLDMTRCKVFEKRDSFIDSFLKDAKAPCTMITVSADGFSNNSVPGAGVLTLYDDNYLYFCFWRSYNVLCGYPGMRNFTSVGWGHSDCQRVDFGPEKRLIAFPNGTCEAKGLVCTPKDIRIMEGGRVCLVRIQLASLGVKGAKKKKIRLDLDDSADGLDDMLAGDAQPAQSESDTDEIAPPTDVSGLEIAFNASVWIEDQRELKSVYPVDGENFATGRLKFAEAKEEEQ